MVLENAYYGLRRPPGQRGPAIARVSDFMLMGSAIIQEARGLAAWLRSEGYNPGLAGFSMGGQMALVAGATLPWALPLVGMSPSASPAPVFTEGPLQAGIDWASLGPDARTRLRALLSPLSILALPPPADPSRAIVVGTARDGFVPPRDMEAIAKHWGAELRWIPSGHFGSIAFHRRELRQAMLDAFSRT
jgi:pimeloyl-ACP methyl ester carboxylesterase